MSEQQIKKVAIAAKERLGKTFSGPQLVKLIEHSAIRQASAKYAFAEDHINSLVENIEQQVREWRRTTQETGVVVSFVAPLKSSKREQLETLTLLSKHDMVVVTVKGGMKISNYVSPGYRDYEYPLNFPYEPSAEEAISYAADLLNRAINAEAGEG